VAALPSIGRATRVERPVSPGADAAGELYERYSAQIFGYCLHQLGSREEAEDAVQTTFMNAFRGLQRGIVPELESAWLFKIAHNVCLSRRRSSWRRGKVEAPNNFEVLQEVIPGREQVADELIRLQDVLEDMPENQRRAILLREWQGLTYREISTELGLSQAAVETLIFRARRALAQGLEQDADTWKKRLRRGADAGGAVASITALFGGGGAAAMKVGATMIAAATAAMAGASAPAPTSTDQASAARAPIASKQVTRESAPARPSAPSGIAPASLAPASAAESGSAERRLPRPVALPSTSPDETTGTAAPASAETAPASAETPQATAAPSAPAAPPEPAESATPAPPTETKTTPANSGHGKGKGSKKDKSDRKPQSLAPAPAEPAPTPPTLPAPPAEQLADALPQPELASPASHDKSEKHDQQDRSDKANGHGNGNK
jgi:RNA polymerase sigma factor (sigma-70 family)